MAEFLPFEAKFAKVWPPARWSDVNTVVGLSGGADSVALLRAMCALKSEGDGRVIAVHFNHGWRGEESNADERFSRELAESLGVECICGRTSEVGSPVKTEESARNERYSFFRSISSQVAARYLVLAHHRDDQVETVLQRFLRGTSLRGLGGMPRLRRLSEMTTVVRPLLGCSRRTVEKYLGRLGQGYRIDSTNANPAWLRNRLRGELIPLLEANYAPQASRSIGKLAAESSEAVAFLDQLAEEALATHVQVDRANHRALLRHADAIHPYLLRLVLMRLWSTMEWPVGAMTRQHWRKLARDLLAKKNGSLGQYPGAIHVSSAEGAYVFRRDNQV